MENRGKTALVTGASRGIGRAAALALADAGFNVAVNYNGSAARAQEVCNACREKGVEAEVYQCNVADNDAVKTMIESIVATFGSIDVLVNNAGITDDGLMLRMSEESFDKVIATNLKGTFNCTQHASKFMLKKKQGKIINIASVVGIHGNAGQANYAASKAGVIGLTKTTAKELAGRHITANAIAPGFIESEMTDALSEKVQKEILAGIPLKQFGKPEDIAGVIVFLASSAGDYITGQVISVDGGMSI